MAINNASFGHTGINPLLSQKKKKEIPLQRKSSSTFLAKSVAAVCSRVLEGDQAASELTMAALTLICTLCYSLRDPSACLTRGLSLGLPLSNDALLLCCFCKSPLFIQFCRRLLPYGSKPPPPSNSHLLLRPQCDANSRSAVRKAE